MSRSDAAKAPPQPLGWIRSCRNDPHPAAAPSFMISTFQESLCGTTEKAKSVGRSYEAN
jgi:hypothetical protein